MAIKDLQEKAMDYCGYQVSSHTTVKNTNGKQDYHNVTAVDKSALIPREGIELIQYEGFWVARIKKSKIHPQKVTWIEQNVTINNTYNGPTTYSNGYRNDISVTRVRRRIDVIGPSGNVVKTIPGQNTVTTTNSRWNGRYGSTWSITKKDR